MLTVDSRIRGELLSCDSQCQTPIRVVAIMNWLNSEIDLRKPEKHHLVLWKYLGLIPPKTSGFKRSLYICCSISVHFILTFCCPLTMIIAMLKAESFGEFCQCAFLSITLTGVSSKFANTFFIMPRLSMVSEVSERLHSRITSPDELECLQKAMSEGHTMVRIITNIFLSGLFVTELVSLTNIFATESVLNTPAWFPFDWKNNRRLFHLCNFYQFLGFFMQGLLVISSDTYIVVYFQYFQGHLKALIVRVQKIGESPGSSSKENLEELINCIKDHQRILK